MMIWYCLSPSPPILPSYVYEQPRGSWSREILSCTPSTLRSIKDRRVALLERERCLKIAEDYSLQTNDLIQQTRAANAAEAQAVLAYRSALISVAQAIAGFLTLIAAGAAAWYARRAAVAANEGLVHSKQTSAAQLRAYITIGGGKIKHEFGDLWTVTVRISNAGLIPAESVNTIMTVKYFELPLPNDIQEDHGNFLNFGRIMHSARRPSKLQAGINLSQDKIDSIKDVRAVVYIKVSANYSWFGHSNQEHSSYEAVVLCDDLEAGSPRIVPSWVYDRPPSDQDGQENLNLQPPDEKVT